MSRHASDPQAGFTFNEVLAALGLIVFVVLAYSLSSIGVIRDQTISDKLTAAIHLAQDKMEQLQANRNLTNDDRCPGAGDRAISATGAAGGIFDRCWRIADSPLGSHLKQVDVTVSWRDYENRKVSITSLVFVDMES
jgi:Tfp pilus assembly protein PilV